MLSIIIPVRNEATFLPQCLASIPRERGVEIIVVDGGSVDGSADLAAKRGARTLRLPEAHRARQMNAGAACARGDVLMFLHADCRAPADVILQVQRAFGAPEVVGGCFRMRLEARRPFFRLLETAGDLFCRLTGWMFGDRGIFVRRDIFRRVNGFPDLPIMEEVRFSERLRKKGQTVLLPGPITCSSRDFEDEPAWTICYRILRACVDYRLGRPVDLVARRYYVARERSRRQERSRGKTFPCVGVR